MSEWRETEVGAIPVHWQVKPLTGLIAFTVDNRGKTVPTIEDTTAFPLIATNCIKEDALYPLKEKLRFISDDTYENWFRSHPQPGDIIIVNKGTPGLVCFVPDPVDFCIAQDMVALRTNEKVYNKYLFAYMRSHYFKYQVYGLNVGTTIPHLKKSNFKELKIPIPSMQEQKVIGDLYYTLSLKIDLLRRQNHTLERIAQTLFNRWFVEFEFPFDFAQGRPDANGRPYRSGGGPMIESELGEIPLGWRVGTFLELFDLLSGGTPKTSVPEYWDGEIKWISGKDTTANHRKFILSTEKQITEDGLNNSATKLLPQFTTVISARGTVGCYCLLPEPMCMSQTNYGIRPKDEKLNFFTYLSVSSIVELLKRQAYGTVFDTITTVTFKQSEILIPPLAILFEFEGTISPFFRKMLVNETQIQTLTNLRDTLLPKLMSGQLRVNNE